MADNSSIKSYWYKGWLRFTDNAGNLVSEIFPSPQNVTTVTTAASLTTKANMGTVVKCGVDGTFITLPVASTTTLAGGEFTIVNTGDLGACQIIIITVTGDSIIGAGISSSGLFSNTKATHVPGDMITVMATGSSSWYVGALSGVWASTT